VSVNISTLLVWDICLRMHTVGSVSQYIHPAHLGHLPAHAYCGEVSQFSSVRVKHVARSSCYSEVKWGVFLGPLVKGILWLQSNAVVNKSAFGIQQPHLISKAL